MPVLKAKINGVWVPLGSGGSGSDEVEVGPTIPTDPGIELWYDTDDPQGQAGGVPAGGALGQVLQKLGNEDYNVGWVGVLQYSLMPRGLIAFALGTALNGVANTETSCPGAQVQWTSVSGRRYLVLSFFAITKNGTTGNFFGYVSTAADAAYSSVTHTFLTGASYSSFTIPHLLTGDGTLLTAKLRVRCDAGTVDVRSANVFVIDLGAGV